jgi:hypothetical protein
MYLYQRVIQLCALPKQGDFLPKLERKIKIESIPENIFKVVTDGFNTPKWNPAVDSVIEIDDKKFKLETDLGPILINKIETDKNKSTTWYTESSTMHIIGYNLNPKKEKETEVVIWTEYDDKSQSKLFKQTADLILEGLKNYVEYIDTGGDPDTYKKYEVITTP